VENNSQANETESLGFIPVISVLSGLHRGHNITLTEKTYRIVIGPDEDMMALPPDDEKAENFQATLHRAADTYEIEVAHDSPVWVNGRRVNESQKLKPDDLLEVGHGGPVARFRLCPRGGVPPKTLSQALVDSFDSTMVDGHFRMGRIGTFFSNIYWNMATQTTRWFRVWLLIIITILVASMIMLTAQNLRLKERVAFEDTRIQEISELLEKHRSETLSRDDILTMDAEIKAHLDAAAARLAQLEAGSAAAKRIIATATPSVAFILGAYGYFDPESGRYLRSVPSADGRTMIYTLDNRGKIVEVSFTGTAFVVSASGLLLTNRHVIEPWRDEYGIAGMTQGRKLKPVIREILVYLPGEVSPFEVEVSGVDDEADLVTLRSTGAPISALPLQFELKQVSPGDEIILMGYPTGIRALLARSSSEFLESIADYDPADFRLVTQRLSGAGYIKPLASRGIVSQVTDEFIVYDAETTFGGSGGPVFDLDGKVIAVNAAIIPEFGGSNMGVPAENVRQFLARSYGDE